MKEVERWRDEGDERDQEMERDEKKSRPVFGNFRFHDNSIFFELRMTVLDWTL